VTRARAGRYVDGLTAAVHEVVLLIEDGHLVGVGGGDELFRWPAASLVCEETDAGRVRISCRATGEAAVTTEADVASGLGLRGAPGPSDLTGRKRRRRRRLAAAFAGGIGAVAVGFYVSLTPIARAIAFHVPPSAEASLGRGLAAVIETQYCETPAARASAEALASRLGAPGTALHIMDTDTVNAFTFPGGDVILTRGLLEKAEGPDEIAGVLGHELEHVRLRHVMIRFVRTSIMTALWQASVGDYSGLFVIDPKTALDVAGLQFSRDDERDADRGALERLDRAHISHEGFAAFFERLQAKTDAIPAWMSSHPASAERITNIRSSGPPKGETTPALSAHDWTALKSGCEKK